MDEPDLNRTRFGLTEQWFALGIVDSALLKQMTMEWERGVDRNPEHYRYSAFRGFLARKSPLTSELAKALYELGLADSDQAMGGSMMVDIVRLRECPQEVLQAALASGRPYLVRTARRNFDKPPS